MTLAIIHLSESDDHNDPPVYNLTESTRTKTLVNVY